MHLSVASLFLFKCLQCQTGCCVTQAVIIQTSEGRRGSLSNILLQVSVGENSLSFHSGLLEDGTGKHLFSCLNKSKAHG